MDRSYPPHRGHPTASVPVKVRRRYLPWRSKTRELAGNAWDLVPESATSFGDDPISAFIAMVWFLLCLPMMIPALLVTPFFLIESLLQWLAAPFALLFQAFGWLSIPIEVSESGKRVHCERVRGSDAATRRIEQIESLAARGVRPPYLPDAPGVQAYARLGDPVLPGMQPPVRR